MTQGKDPQDADGLGGVHTVALAREAVDLPPRDPEPVVVVDGERAGFSRLVEDRDQVAKVIHTVDAPIEPESDANARESTLRPTRTPGAPLQDVQVSPDEPSVWTAAKGPSAP
jgi:uncharacterized protein YdcH (DUF465 family)